MRTKIIAGMHESPILLPQLRHSAGSQWYVKPEVTRWLVRYPSKTAVLRYGAYETYWGRELRESLASGKCALYRTTRRLPRWQGWGRIGAVHREVAPGGCLSVMGGKFVYYRREHLT